MARSIRVMHSSILSCHHTLVTGVAKCVNFRRMMMELGCRLREEKVSGKEMCIIMWDTLRASPEPASRNGWQALRKHTPTVFQDEQRYWGSHRYRMK